MGNQRTESKKRQQAARRSREKGLSHQEIINLRKLNAIVNTSGNVEEAGIGVIDEIKASRGSRRTHIRRRRLIQLSGAQNHRCCYCGQKTWHPYIIDGGDVIHSRWNRATIEHVIALVEGGTWCKNNLVMACDQCNGARGEKSVGRFVALITKNINIPISKTIKRALKKEERRKSEKGQIRQAKTLRLLYIAATLNPTLFALMIKECEPERIKTPRTRRCHFSSIRKRVIANGMVFR